MKELLQKSKSELISEVHNLRSQLAAARKHVAEQGQAKLDIADDELFALMPEAHGDEVFLATETGRLVYMNTMMLGRLGYEPGEVQLLTIPDIDQEHSRGEWLFTVSSLKRSGKPVATETKHTSRDSVVYEKKILLKYVNVRGRNYVLGIAEVKADKVEVKELPQTAVSRESFMMGLIFDGIIIVDTKGNIRETNPAAERIIGLPRNEIVGRSYLDPRWRFMDQDMKPMRISENPFGQALVEENSVMGRKAVLVRHDGNKVPLSINAVPMFDASRRLSGAMACLHQGDLKSDEIENGEYKMTPAEIKQELMDMIFRSESIHVVERYTCEVLQRHLGLQLVWIGTVAAGDYRIHPGAFAGDRSDFLLKIKIRYDNSELGNGPSGRAIKLGEPQMVTDIETDPTMTPWKKQAIGFGLKSILSLPVRAGNDVYGVLNLYSGDKNFFSQTLKDELADIAGTLSFGWATLTNKTMAQELGQLHSIISERFSTLTRSMPNALALFEAAQPHLCLTANDKFKEVLDQPYRSSGVENLLLGDFAASCMLPGLYDKLQLASVTAEEVAETDVQLTMPDGSTENWDWRIVPLKQDGEICELLLLAWKSGTRKAGEAQPDLYAKPMVAEETAEFALISGPCDAIPEQAGESAENRIAHVFDVVEQGVMCLDLPEIAPRAKRDKRVQQVFDDSKVVLCNNTAMHLLGIEPDSNPTGRPGKDVLPSSDDFIDAVVEAVSSKSGKQSFSATLEVKGVGFRILQYGFHLERTPELPLKLWLTVTEMS